MNCTHFSALNTNLNLFTIMGKQGYNHGDFGWMQLATAQPESAMQFYTSLLGWDNKGEPMPGYHCFGSAEENYGGIMAPGEGQDAGGWLPFVTVNDLDAALDKAQELGGSIVQPITPIPDGGRIAVIADPQGVSTGLAQYVNAPSE